MNEKRKMTCPSCGKRHEVDAETLRLFGPDVECMKCVDWKHVDFMRSTGKKLGLSCVKGCRCGFGK